MPASPRTPTGKRLWRNREDPDVLAIEAEAQDLTEGARDAAMALYRATAAERDAALARLREVEAERDTDKHKANWLADTLIKERDAALAVIARYEERVPAIIERADTAEIRLSQALAEVERLSGRTIEPKGDSPIA